LIAINYWGNAYFSLNFAMEAALSGGQSAAGAILEKTRVPSATVIPRMPKSSAPPCAAAFVALAALACLVLAACSPGADYPSLFPSVHDVPPPRADAPLDSNQVQQATEDLITARDRLTAEAQGTQGKGSTGSANPAAKSGAKPASKSAANSAATSAAMSPAKSVANSAGKFSGNSSAGATNTGQSAGTETK
jgi:hypothetical protein